MQKTILSALLFFVFFMAKAQEWQTDLNEAQKIASEKNQHIILVFQGSDWCGPCIKLDTQIWSTQQFKNYAENNFVMLKADFPKKKKNALEKTQQEKNNKLAEKYNPNGFFPYVVILDKNAKPLGSTGYKNISPSAYIDLLTSF